MPHFSLGSGTLIERLFIEFPLTNASKVFIKLCSITLTVIFLENHQSIIRFYCAFLKGQVIKERMNCPGTIVKVF